LGDPLGESGVGLRQVQLESHLALQCGDRDSTNEADASLGDLGGWVLVEAVTEPLGVNIKDLLR
jgi:hypothetical protein